MATKKEMRRALERAVEAIGSYSAVARLLNLTRQGVQSWDICPPNRVVAISKASGVPRHELRPDLYPEE